VLLRRLCRCWDSFSAAIHRLHRLGTYSSVYTLLRLRTLFLWAERTTSLSALIGLALSTSLISVGIEQLLGFYCFPGLVKDLDAFSWEHLQRLGVILIGTFAWYSAVAALTHFVARRMRLF